MQQENEPKPFPFQSVESAIKPPRLGRYMMSAGYNREEAINVYMWNAELAEAFQFPLHVAEVICRNSIQKGLQVRFANPWYEQEEFRRLLDDRQRQHLVDVLNEELNQHAKRMCDDHVVSSLNFGFWDHLTTKRFNRTLWHRGVKHNFPNAFAENKSVADVNDVIQRVRRWRNRIAHHRAIFDKQPERKYAEVMALIRWCCNDTADWVESLSKVSDVLDRRPKPSQPAATKARL